MEVLNKPELQEWHNLRIQRRLPGSDIFWQLKDRDGNEFTGPLVSSVEGGAAAGAPHAPVIGAHHRTRNIAGAATPRGWGRVGDAVYLLYDRAEYTMATWIAWAIKQNGRFNAFSVNGVLTSAGMQLVVYCRVVHTMISTKTVLVHGSAQAPEFHLTALQHAGRATLTAGSNAGATHFFMPKWPPGAGGWNPSPEMVSPPPPELMRPAEARSLLVPRPDGAGGGGGAPSAADTVRLVGLPSNSWQIGMMVAAFAKGVTGLALSKPQLDRLMAGRQCAEMDLSDVPDGFLREFLEGRLQLAPAPRPAAGVLRREPFYFPRVEMSWIFFERSFVAAAQVIDAEPNLAFARDIDGLAQYLPRGRLGPMEWYTSPEERALICWASPAEYDDVVHIWVYVRKGGAHPRYFFRRLRNVFMHFIEVEGVVGEDAQTKARWAEQKLKLFGVHEITRLQGIFREFACVCKRYADKYDQPRAIYGWERINHAKDQAAKHNSVPLLELAWRRPNSAGVPPPRGLFEFPAVAAAPALDATPMQAPRPVARRGGQAAAAAAGRAGGQQQVPFGDVGGGAGGSSGAGGDGGTRGKDPGKRSHETTDESPGAARAEPRPRQLADTAAGAVAAAAAGAVAAVGGALAGALAGMVNALGGGGGGDGRRRWGRRAGGGGGPAGAAAGPLPADPDSFRLICLNALASPRGGRGGSCLAARSACGYMSGSLLWRGLRMPVALLYWLDVAKAEGYAWPDNALLLATGGLWEEFPTQGLAGPAAAEVAAARGACLVGAAAAGGGRGSSALKARVGDAVDCAKELEWMLQYLAAVNGPHVTLSAALRGDLDVLRIPAPALRGQYRDAAAVAPYKPGAAEAIEALRVARALRNREAPPAALIAAARDMGSELGHLMLRLVDLRNGELLSARGAVLEECVAEEEAWQAAHAPATAAERPLLPVLSRRLGFLAESPEALAAARPVWIMEGAPAGSRSMFRCAGVTADADDVEACAEFLLQLRTDPSYTGTMTRLAHVLGPRERALVRLII
ncbi:MAG: hypothetical protein J3K34DRAFT_515447 [Monoraphidium minutum]|nr:MAG: hypothetical protein J3K34DRAFT_515447 [Monoraphidium minutum]